MGEWRTSDLFGPGRKAEQQEPHNEPEKCPPEGQQQHNPVDDDYESGPFAVLLTNLLVHGVVDCVERDIACVGE